MGRRRGQPRGVLMLAALVVCARAASGVLATAPPTTLARLAIHQPAADPVLGRWIASFEPQTRVLSVVAADIDRDGDVDLIGTTGEDVVAVWLNSGLGQFTRQAPVPRSWLRQANTLAGAQTGAGAPATTTGSRGDYAIGGRQPLDDSLGPSASHAPPGRALIDTLLASRFDRGPPSSRSLN